VRSGARLQQKVIDVWRSVITFDMGQYWCRPRVVRRRSARTASTEYASHVPVPQRASAPCTSLALVTGRSSVTVDIDRLAAQIVASRFRCEQLLATAEIVMARADATLRGAPVVLRSVQSSQARMLASIIAHAGRDTTCRSVHEQLHSRVEPMPWVGART
jgi:hypothetical protein